MASMIALLEEQDELVPGSVLPIDRYLTDDSALAPLGHGGTLYVVAIGENEKLFLVAALEQPERSRVFRGDMRPDGWYAPANTVPVTEIGKLRKVLGVGTKAQQARKLRDPRKITKEAEAKLRAAFDESDAPVIEAAVVRSASIEARIAELLALWQTTPAVEIADAIDRATRLLPRSDQPLLDSHDEDAGHEVWMRVWNDANERAAAMPRLVQNLFIHWNTMLDRRLAALAKAQPDPRIARQIARRAHSVPMNTADSAAKLVARTPDRTAWEAIGAVYLELEDMSSTARRDAFAFTANPPATVTLTDDVRARVTAIDAELAALEDRTEHELVDAIAEHPDDDEPYLVYADWLQGRGHPRGEYIALACQKHRKGLSPALARRLAALESLPYLAGPIDDLATTRRRPTPRGIDRDVDVYWNTTELAWREAARHPLARAIRKLDFMAVQREQRLEGIAVFAEAAPQLHRIEGLLAGFVIRLAKRLGAGWRADGEAVVRR